MMLFGLADCNNFFVSCERVFNPGLCGRPVLVLSNNDGCVVSRSNEAKQLGIKMGEPLFKIADKVKEHDIAVFSSNYALYGDLSRRVMTMLARFTPDLRQYSIDEAFLDFTGMGDTSFLASYGRDIVKTIGKGVGIPVSLGIAPTKTLAKMASKFAKKYKAYEGVCIIDNDDKREKALRLFDAGDVFGIGRQTSRRLADMDIRTAWDFVNLNPDLVKRRFSVTLLDTWRELRGESCVNIDDLPEKKSICTSRSFVDRGIDSLDSLEESVAGFASDCAARLRRQRTCCTQMVVFAQTSRFNNIDWFDINQNVSFQVPTNSTSEIIKYAVRALRMHYDGRKHFFKRAGVIVWDMVPQNAVQGSLFDTEDRERQSLLSKTVDAINNKLGHETVRIATQGTAPRFRTCSRHLSPLYTTDFNDIMVLKC